MNSILKGVIPVVPTPLDDNDRFDSDAMQHLVDFYVESGCHGLLILGSGGEYPYFSFEERKEITLQTAAHLKGRIPLVVGAGFMSTSETIKFVHEVEDAEISTFLVILPTYYPVEFNDINNFYESVCASTAKPVLFYYYPQQTLQPLTVEQISRILTIDGMAGMKYSALKLGEIRRLSRIFRNQSAIFSGNSFAIENTIRAGCSGIIDVLVSVIPGTVVKCYNAVLENDHKSAAVLQKQILDLLPLMNSLFLPARVQVPLLKIIMKASIPMTNRNASRTSVVKEALHQLGHPVSSLSRAPQPQVTELDRIAIRRILGQIRSD